MCLAKTIFNMKKKSKTISDLYMIENHFYEELTVQEMKRIIAPLYKSWDENMFKKYHKNLSITRE